MKPQLKGNWYKWLFVALRIFWCLKEKKRPAVVKLRVFCSPNLPGQKHYRHAVVYHVLLDWDPVQLLNTLTPCDSFNSFTIFFTFFYLYFFYFLNFYTYWLRFKIAFCNFKSQPSIPITSGTINPCFCFGLSLKSRLLLFRNKAQRLDSQKETGY